MMFENLLEDTFKPKVIVAIEDLPEITIPEELRLELQEVLKEEEKDDNAHVFSKSAVVRIDRNFVIFPLQWLYLATICKEYAKALKPYGDFFDENIKGNEALINDFVNNNYDGSCLAKLLPDQEDRNRMKGYVIGGDSSSFRPGKALINGNSIRATKDIFGSCVLKKLPVPDSSSSYLGNLIYYLSKRPDLYDKIEKEVLRQLNYTLLPNEVKQKAKAIIDCIYKIDGFERINNRFVLNRTSVKIGTSDMGGLLANNRYLGFVFNLPNARANNPEDLRVFNDVQYSFLANGQRIECRLSTEWSDNELQEDPNGTRNILSALISVVNRDYSELLEIKEVSHRLYLVHKLHLVYESFSKKNLPEPLASSFSRRFITSLLAKPFVILSGNSGSGKTRMAKQFAEYLQVVDKNGEKNWLMVPVGADWTDNTKILGFYNPLANNTTGKYEKTSVLKLIERANCNPSVPYFLILDEMNLSHVERYFSDFLSHMETENSPFELDGYNTASNLGNQTKDELPYPENLFVIGTVNIDETTYMFSPKVLDRANVIEFKPNKDSVLSLFTDSSQAAEIIPAGPMIAEDFLKLALEIRKGQKSLSNENSEKVKNIFSAIYDVVKAKGFEFSYRTVKEIKQYICATFEFTNSDERDVAKLSYAIDEQLLQKILPKIHGNRKEIGDMLTKLDELCSQKHLSLSLEKIKQMEEKLANVQYASFI